MNPSLIACAFLIGCTATLALGQDDGGNQNVPRPDIRAQHVDGVLHDILQDAEGHNVTQQHVDDPLQQVERQKLQADERSYKEWLSKQSRDLLDIIEILYKGREADLKVLEDAQSAMSLEDQIEHRIALIKATLSEKTAKP